MNSATAIEKLPTHILLTLESGRLRAETAAVLRGAGHKVVETAGVDDALHLARNEPPGLIFLDGSKADGTGREILRRLREDAVTEQIPAIFLFSGSVAPDVRAEALDLGADGYLDQSVAEAELLAHVRRHLRQAGLNDATRRIEEDKERNALLHNLGERVKELQLYHGAAELLQRSDLPLDRMLQEIVALIPPGMEASDHTEAQIVLGDTAAATPGYRSGKNRLAVSFPLRGQEKGGRIEVVDLRKNTEGGGSFLEAERSVLESMGGMLRAYFDRRVMEDERTRSDAMLRIVGRVARIGGWSIELPEQKLTWSNEVRIIHEIPPGEQPTLNEAIAFYPEKYRAEVGELVERCIREGQSFQFEMELITAKGRRIPVMAIGEAERDKTGAIIRLQGALQDLSELKALEATAEANERRFRQLAESMPMVVWTADTEGNINYANQRLFEFTEAQPFEDPNIRWQRFVHPDDLAPALEEWSRCVREEMPFDMTYRLLHRKGNSYHWFHVQAQPIREPDGTVSHWFGTGVDIHASRILEEKSTQLAERLGRTLESITDGFFTVDQEWRFTYINAEMERFVEKDRTQLLGKVIWDAFPDAVGTRIEVACRKAMAEKKTIRFEEYYAPMERCLSLRVYPSADGLSVFFQDVTKQKKDEEQMRLLAQAIASLNDIIIITQADLLDKPGPEIVFVNEAFERLTGYSAAEAIGQSPRFLQGPDSDRAALDRIREALRAGRPVREEVLNYGKDGRTYLLEINIQPVRDADGTITHFVAVQRNVTEERAAEEVLRESEERFHTLLQNVPTVAIQGYGLDGTVYYWNKASEALYGYTEAEAMGSNLLDLIIPPEMREEVIAQLSAVEAGADNIPTGELTLACKDGSRVNVICSHSVLRRPDRPVELFCIDVDITERKKLETQFLRAQRMESIGTLAGGIAHDLNNMLSPIIMGVSLMRQFDEAKELLPMIDDIQASAERGRDLVKQVLAFARGADGARVMLDINCLIDEVATFVQKTFPKNITFEKEIAADLWEISGDPTQINQVLLNLCVNARDAMPEGGHLRIAAENLSVDRQYAAMFAKAQPGRYVIIEVSDEGCGMDAATRERVFEPFFTTKELGEGTGLGLSTVMGIVRGHGGFINVYSEPGAGTRFTVYLPVGKDEDIFAARTVDEFDVRIPRGHGEGILVVDDEASIRSMSQLTLETYGYKVMTAENGAQATERYRAHRDSIDLLVTDIMMPEMDGIALIRNIRAIDPSLPVLATSGLKANGNKIKTIESGVADFLTKPFTAGTLLRAVHGILHPEP